MTEACTEGSAQPCSSVIMLQQSGENAASVAGHVITSRACRDPWEHKGAFSAPKLLSRPLLKSLL